MTPSNLDLARECGALTFGKGPSLVMDSDQLDAFVELIRVLEGAAIFAASAHRRLHQIAEPDWYHAECDDPDRSGFYLEKSDAQTQVNDHGGHVTELFVAPQPQQVTEPAISVDEMVNRFLGWKLPKDFAPDCGISFKPPHNGEWGPVGTNLFSADQARRMFEYVLAGAIPSAQSHQIAEPASQPDLPLQFKIDLDSVLRMVESFDGGGMIDTKKVRAVVKQHVQQATTPKEPS